jgi:hypothetical protein
MTWKDQNSDFDPTMFGAGFLFGDDAILSNTTAVWVFANCMNSTTSLLSKFSLSIEEWYNSTLQLSNPNALNHTAQPLFSYTDPSCEDWFVMASPLNGFFNDTTSLANEAMLAYLINWNEAYLRSRKL